MPLALSGTQFGVKRMRKPVIVATAIVAAALAAGFAFAGVQTTQGQASTPERDATYRSCLQAADAKFDGLNLDLLVGDAADKVALRNRALRRLPRRPHHPLERLCRLLPRYCRVFWP
jgi:hypothetical protein